MKTRRKLSQGKGFTLMELMVAMAITTIIVTVLVSVTSMALDTWNRSRAETRAARQAKTMIDTLANDLESLVSRRGTSFEWLYAAPGDKIGPANNQSPNAAKLTFFTAATDRYDGQVGNPQQDKGGDVSCVSYQLAYKDPIKGDTQDNYSTFALYRLLVNPDETFQNLLGRTDLDAAFTALHSPNDVLKEANFVCENVYQFSVTFNVQVDVAGGGGSSTTYTVPVTITDTNGSAQVNELRLKGSGIVSSFTGNSNVDAPAFAAGRLVSAEISLTVISDSGLEQLRRRTNLSGTAKSEFLAKNSFQYSKLIQLPSM